MYFKTTSIQILRPFESAHPTFAEWQAARIAAVMDVEMGKVSLVDAVEENFGLIDIVFAGLGVATAYKLAEGLGTARGARTYGRRGGERRPQRRSGSGDGGPQPRSTSGRAPTPRRRRR